MKKPKKKIKIIFAAQDPGGFNALWPVIKKIMNQARISVVLSAEAKAIAKRKKIDFIDANAKSGEQLKKVLEKFDPQVVVAGTSQGLSIDKKIIVWAKRKKIPTISVIDFWANYKVRFSNPNTADLAYLPDFICVVDDYMKKQMVKEGFRADQLIITGNPFFDTFSSYPGINGKHIVFVEQPFSEIYDKNDKSISVPIFDETEIFTDVVRALEKKKIFLPIFIALHPRCKKINKFDHIIFTSKIKIKIAKEKTEKLIAGAKLITGINSMVLFEAAMTGKPVLSYQPNLKKPDPLISNRLGLSQAVYKKKNLYLALKKLLSIRGKKQNRELIKKYTQNKSTQKVIDFIINFLKNDS